MTNSLTMVAVLCLSIATTGCLPRSIPGFGLVKGITKKVTSTITKNVAAIKDPIAKTVAAIAFGHCHNVKNVMGLNDDNKESEVDLSQLRLDYITSDATLQYRLSSLKQLPSTPNFDPQRGLAIYVHGFIDNPFKASYAKVSDAFITQGNYNILAFDASAALSMSYLYASSMVRFIGKALGKAVAAMMEGLNFTSIHLVGHSLGSHIASFAGKTIYSLTGHRVGRITGLDPAGPCFAEVDSGLKLNMSDADFVDVIHTNAKMYGLNEQVGHVDYYPNGGSEQPTCVLQSCSHSRAWVLFAESVLNPEGFPAVLCDSWTDFKNKNCYFNYTSYMGYASCPGGPRGKYYLQTAEHSPYALGDVGTNYTNKDPLLKSLINKFRWNKDRRFLVWSDL